MINIDELSFSYNTHNNKRSCIIKNIQCTVEKSECVTIIGPSGAGKTTFLRLLAGLETGYKGRINIDGRTPEEARKEGLVGFVFQQPVLFPWRTVEQNIELPLEVNRKNKEVCTAKEMLGITALEKYSSYYPHQLSGGMQSRVAIARALITKPNLLLLDEPFADLDEINRERMNLELQQIWMKTKATMFFVTHDISEAIFLADRVLVLSARPAQIHQEFKVDFPRPRTRDLLDSSDFDNLLALVRRSLRSATMDFENEE